MTAPLFAAVAAAWLCFALFLLCAGWLSSRSSVASADAKPFRYRKIEEPEPQETVLYMLKEMWTRRKRQ